MREPNGAWRDNGMTYPGARQSAGTSRTCHAEADLPLRNRKEHKGVVSGTQLHISPLGTRALCYYVGQEAKPPEINGRFAINSSGCGLSPLYCRAHNGRAQITLIPLLLL